MPGPPSSARAKADQERSVRLLKAIDEAADDGRPGDSPFLALARSRW
ncbi:hypothetical protein ACIQVA_34315 [Streptomyces microflavus]